MSKLTRRWTAGAALPLPPAHASTSASSQATLGGVTASAKPDLSQLLRYLANLPAATRSEHLQHAATLFACSQEELAFATSLVDAAEPGCGQAQSRQRRRTIALPDPKITPSGRRATLATVPVPPHGLLSAQEDLLGPQQRAAGQIRAAEVILDTLGNDGLENLSVPSGISETIIPFDVGALPMAGRWLWVHWETETMANGPFDQATLATLLGDLAPGTHVVGGPTRGTEILPAQPDSASLYVPLVLVKAAQRDGTVGYRILEPGADAFSPPLCTDDAAALVHASVGGFARLRVCSDLRRVLPASPDDAPAQTEEATRSRAEQVLIAELALSAIARQAHPPAAHVEDAEGEGDNPGPFGHLDYVRDLAERYDVVYDNDLALPGRWFELLPRVASSVLLKDLAAEAQGWADGVYIIGAPTAPTWFADSIQNAESAPQPVVAVKQNGKYYLVPIRGAHDARGSYLQPSLRIYTSAEDFVAGVRRRIPRPRPTSLRIWSEIGRAPTASSPSLAFDGAQFVRETRARFEAEAVVSEAAGADTLAKLSGARRSAPKRNPTVEPASGIVKEIWDNIQAEPADTRIDAAGVLAWMDAQGWGNPKSLG